MQKISLALAIALMIVSAVAGIGIGYRLTPQYMLSMYDKNIMDLGQPDKWVDLRYIDAMIAHHRGAMLLAEEARRSERPEIRDLAAAILKDEPKNIDELYLWKKSWYSDTRPVRDPQVPRLTAVDKTFDLRFLNALIAHHRNGVLMTREIRLKSSRPEILDNADAVEQFLTGGIAMLRSWRTKWYNVTEPQPLPVP
ncbi:MAG: DUF305 domain-containing protein [Chlorobiaceae bacterium]|nr:DUF305 domain-containing protein [Chlorobiaceae bacterium]